ncbi:MAG: RNA polymerase sigma factor (sigma-70 family) [Myxococcota bacterium]|jgi:RNA polymerase sigma factor (sigma-70 family)
MHALSFADQMCLLEELVTALADIEADDDALIAEAQEWASRVDETLAWTETFMRFIAELVETVQRTDSRDARANARAGLAYLSRSGGPEPEALSQLSLQAHAFVLSLVVHKVRRALGRTTAYVPPELSAEDRGRAEDILAGLRAAPIASDDALLEATRAFCADPGIPIESAFVRRLLRNAEFLANVLESKADEQDADTARAALGYLILEEDSIDDRLGLVGFLDDAWILDQAVSSIEPAREPWLRLLECAADAWPLLAEASIAHDGDQAVPVSRFILTDAALLAEPLAPGSGALEQALFVPTAGSTPVLLGVAAVIEMMREASQGPKRLRADTDSLPAGTLTALVESVRNRTFEQVVLVAAPLKRARGIVSSIVVDGSSLDELIPIGGLGAEGQVERWSEDPLGIDPLLVFVPTLEDAASFVEARRSHVRFVLVDFEVASGDEPIEPATEEIEEDEDDEDSVAEVADPMKAERARRKRRVSTSAVAASVDLLNRYMDEASAISRLTPAEEDQLSLAMIAAREKMVQGLARMGPMALDGIKLNENVPGRLLKRLTTLAGQRQKAKGAKLAGIIEEQERLLGETGMVDENFADVVKRRLPELKQARAARRDADLAQTLRKSWRVTPEAFVEGYTELADGNAEVERCVVTLTRCNLRLVLWMAKRYRSRSFYLDMVQEGNLGLMRAARKFDHRKGARFGSYAGWWIRQAIEGYLSRHSRTIRIPVNTLATVRRVSKVEQALTDTLHRAPTLDEIAEQLGIKASDVRRARRIGHDLERGCVALDGPIDRESGTTLNEVIPDTEHPLPLEEITTRQMAQEARILLESLDPLESRVIHLRFGIGDNERHTLAAIGAMVGLTKERIRQIELKAIGKLRFRAKRTGVRP